MKFIKAFLRELASFMSGFREILDLCREPEHDDACHDQHERLEDVGSLSSRHDHVLVSGPCSNVCIIHESKKSNIRTLFILKRREDYNLGIKNIGYGSVATGMFTSASLVSDMLNSEGIKSKVVIVVDNNDIDREVKAFNATHVFIEGYWVVPEKFDVLKPLHPNVTWVVRCHSEIPFLATEGVAFDWTRGYLQRGVVVAPNSPRAHYDLETFATGHGIDADSLLPLLTNFYPTEAETTPEYTKKPESDSIDIGCFGAVRPLKNQLIQAIAAYKYARLKKKKLRFHINANRIEGNGDNALKNIRGFFKDLECAELVQHAWMGHDEFMQVVGSMDVLMQVSLSETYNIVTADAVAMGVPVLVSPEVPFVRGLVADPVSSLDMERKLELLLEDPTEAVIDNYQSMRTYSKHTKLRWMRWLDHTTINY